MSIKIILDNYNNICYPGQTIAGRISCYFDKPKKLRAIRIKFKGRAETEWTESESYYDSVEKKNKSRSVRYYGSEVYFEAEYTLVQGDDGFYLPAGQHSYPFSYILPPQLPSSFEGSYGNVRYYVKGTVDRPWKFDYEDKVPLNLMSPLDLNYIHGLKDPVNISENKSLCSCWCNDSGILTFKVSLPASGFVTGQDVNIGAYVQNMTNTSVESVKFKITREIEFITQFPRTHRRYDKDIVSACIESGIGAHGDKSWTSTLTIPNEHFPNMIPCGIINTSYILKAKAVLPCPHSDLDTEVRIMIGSVPLQGVNVTFTAGPPPEFPIPIAPPAEGAPPPASGFQMPPSPVGGPYPGGPQNGVAAPPYPEKGSAPSYPANPTAASYPPGPTAAPYPTGSAAVPYPPSPTAAPYPPGSTAAPYPPSPTAAPYPPGSTAAPYPPGPTAAPYPTGPAAGPYPPSPTAAAYPPGSTAARYPPGSTAAPYPPSPTAAPYPPGSTAAPYPPSPTAAPYPPGSTAAPYPPGPTAAPYPTGSAAVPYLQSPTAAPYPPSPTAAPYPPGPTAALYPPGPTAAPYPPGPTAAPNRSAAPYPGKTPFGPDTSNYSNLEKSPSAPYPSRSASAPSASNASDDVPYPCSTAPPSYAEVRKEKP